MKKAKAEAIKAIVSKKRNESVVRLPSFIVVLLIN